MFEDFFKEAKEKSKPATYTNIDISKMSALNIDYFREQLLYNLNNLADNELYTFLSTNYKTVLQDIIDKRDERYLKIVSNTRFLSIFNEVLRHNTLNIMEIKNCNKIAYSFLTHNLAPDDEYIRSLYFNMSSIVNSHIVMRLIGVGVCEELAALLAIARYSHDNELYNSKRVNNVLISSKTLLTEQIIINIFEILYDEFYILFNGVMYDVYSEQELDAISTEANEIYSNMSLALIDMMNTLPDQVIYLVLVEYLSVNNTSKDYSDTRFKLYSLNSTDYYRILQVLDRVVAEKGFYSNTVDI